MGNTRQLHHTSTTVGMHMLSIALLAIISAILAGCSNNEEKELLRPEFETAPIQLFEGETTIIKILNASQVQTTSVPPFISVEPIGATLKITGLEMGEGKLIISADRHPLQCTIRVFSHGIGNGTTNESSEETEVQLRDKSLRITFNKRELRYSAKGTIFTMSHDKHEIKAVSLTTGEEMQLILNAPLHNQPTSVRFMLNGIELATTTVEQMRHDNSGTWLRVATRTDGYIWAIIPSDF